MLTVFAGLMAIVAFIVLTRPVSHTQKTHEAKPQSPAPGQKPGAKPGTTAPTTTIITGHETTGLFVTTTTPITTTTSTTTTIPLGPALYTDTNEVRLGRSGSASFTVLSANPEGVDFSVTRVPPGISASPNHGAVRVGAPVPVTLRVTDSVKARSGTIVLVSGSEARVRIQVDVDNQGPAVTEVHTVPSKPACNQAVLLAATVAGSEIASVTFRPSGGGASVSMQATGGDTWSALLPAAQVGSSVSGTVTAVDAQGRSASKKISVTVGDDDGCGP